MKVRITLIKSLIGRKPYQRGTARALGLRRIGATVEKEASPSIMGMVKAIDFMLRVEKLEAGKQIKPAAAARAEKPATAAAKKAPAAAKKAPAAVPSGKAPAAAKKAPAAVPSGKAAPKEKADQKGSEEK